MSGDRERRDPAGLGHAEETAWSSLATEARHPASERLDRMPTERAVALLLAEDRAGVERALERVGEIARAAEWLAETYAAGGEVLIAGAGTSGRLAVLEAAECPPTFGTDPARLRAVIAGGPEAVFHAREGAEDRVEDGVEAAAGLSSGDLLIAVSASSVTPYVAGALSAARARGGRTVLLTCAAPGAVADRADLVIALATGPEVLTGSTRLKAGSATKAALNAITTAAMVRLGKAYRNWMVDLRPGSAKLRDRALRIVAAAGGVDRETAARWLEASGGEVKIALVAGRLGLSPAEARTRLAAARGQVWRALGEASD